MIYRGKKTEHCDPRAHDVIGRNFEKSSSREINLFYCLRPLPISTLIGRNFQFYPRFIASSEPFVCKIISSIGNFDLML